MKSWTPRRWKLRTGRNHGSRARPRRPIWAARRRRGRNREHPLIVLPISNSVGLGRNEARRRPGLLDAAPHRGDPAAPMATWPGRSQPAAQPGPDFEHETPAPRVPHCAAGARTEVVPLRQLGIHGDRRKPTFSHRFEHPPEPDAKTAAHAAKRARGRSEERGSMAIPDTGAVASLLNGYDPARRGRTDRRRFVRKGRRRSSLGVPTDPGAGRSGAASSQTRRSDCRISVAKVALGVSRDAPACATQHIAAGAVMGALPIGLTGLVQRGGRTAGANGRRMERVGGSDAGRPAGTDRCEEFAPRGPSGRSEENSATAGASKTTSST